MKKYTLQLVITVIFSIMMQTLQAQQLVRHDSYYMYGNQKIYKSDISYFLKTNCPEAYKQYHNKHLKVGWGICVPSMAMVVGGMVMSFASSEDNIIYAGIGIGVAGAVGVLSSMFILPRGYEQRRKTCSVFNSQCARYSKATPMLLNLHVSPQSLSMVLAF